MSGDAKAVVRLGTVMAGAVPFSVGNISDTYRGAVYTDSGIVTAILKDLTSKELANEVLSAAIGSMLRLPIPPSLLAWASADRLPATKGPEVDDGRLVFASTDVGRPQVAMLYAGGGGPRVLERLAAWRDLGLLYGFDAFVANIDRHAGNLLFSGDNEVWLIDHGHCFTGPDWTKGDLAAPDRSLASRLNEWLTPMLDNKRRNQTAAAAATIEESASKLDLPDVALANHVNDLLDGGDLNAVLSFLSGRYPHVPRLAARSLGIDWIV